MPALPPKGFASRPLVLHSPPSAPAWLRVYPSGHTDPLGFGKGPSRFSGPRPLPPAQRYGVVYAGSALKVSVLEAIVRDRGDGRLADLIIARRELDDALCAEIACGGGLQLVNLRDDGRIMMGVPDQL